MTCKHCGKEKHEVGRRLDTCVAESLGLIVWEVKEGKARKRNSSFGGSPCLQDGFYICINIHDMFCKSRPLPHYSSNWNDAMSLREKIKKIGRQEIEIHVRGIGKMKRLRGDLFLRSLQNKSNWLLDLTPLDLCEAFLEAMDG